MSTCHWHDAWKLPAMVQATVCSCVLLPMLVFMPGMLSTGNVFNGS